MDSLSFLVWLSSAWSTFFLSSVFRILCFIFFYNLNIKIKFNLLLIFLQYKYTFNSIFLTPSSPYLLSHNLRNVCPLRCLCRVFFSFVLFSIVLMLFNYFIPLMLFNYFIPTCWAWWALMIGSCLYLEWKGTIPDRFLTGIHHLFIFLPMTCLSKVNYTMLLTPVQRNVPETI